jgi:hypothetical protein
MMNFVNVNANRGRRKNAGAGGARANAGRKKAAESAGDALAVINQPATPTVAKKIKSKRMNFDSPDNQELMNEAIQGFRNKRGRFCATMCFKRPGSLPGLFASTLARTRWNLRPRSEAGRVR